VDITLTKEVRVDDTVMHATTTWSIALTGLRTSVTRIFHRRTTKARAFPLEAITRRKIRDVTIIRRGAHHIRWAASVTTGRTAAGRERSATRQTVTTPAGAT